MNKQIFSALVTGCLLALMLAIPARAQIRGSVMHATIPFDFIVRGKTLPAGNYEIRRINDEPQGLFIRNANNKHDTVIFETESVTAKTMPDMSEVIFHRYGDSYFLSEVFTAGEQTGRELAPSPSERRLRREMEMASNRSEPETVALAVY